MALSQPPLSTPYPAKSDFHIKYGAVDIHFSHSSAIDEPRLTLTPGENIDFIGSQSFSDATVLLVDSQYTLWAQDGAAADTITADSTGVLARFLEDIVAITRDQELILLLHADMVPFGFHVSRPCQPSMPLTWPIMSELFHGLDAITLFSILEIHEANILYYKRFAMLSGWDSMTLNELSIRFRNTTPARLYP